MNAQPVTALNFHRRRADALHLGPSADAVAEILAELKADDSDVADALGCFEQAEYDRLDALLGPAFRSGDWVAYNAEVSRLLAAVLQERAYQRARREQQASWNDAEEP